MIIEVADDFEDGILDPDIWEVHGFDEAGYKSMFWEQNGHLETRFVRCDNHLSAIYRPLAPGMQNYDFQIDFTLAWSGDFMDSKFGYRTLGDFDDPISSTDIPGPSWPESGFFVWSGYGDLLRVYAFVNNATVLADEYSGDTTLTPGHGYGVKFELEREQDTLDVDIEVFDGEDSVIRREATFLLTAESYVPDIFSIWGRMQGGTWHGDCRSLMLEFDNFLVLRRDGDGDGIADVDDNCPDDSNPDQADTDLDGDGDACDLDDDNDGVLDLDDNCQFTANVDQSDLDYDGLGDPCDADVDGDGVCDDPAVQIQCAGGPDNCPTDPNAFQTDTDGDGAGDECDMDDDNDGVCDTAQDGAGCTGGPDNCPTLVNPDQADGPDGDGIGDLCDADDDNDGADDDVDNCPVTANPDQNDTDMDGDGDACDTDDDNDGVADVDDNCQFVSNGDQTDTDGNGVGDACNDADDRDGDEWSDALDNCPDTPNSEQNDFDGDGEGDACDPDIDGDGVDNGSDLCGRTPLGELVNPANGCTVAQLCPCNGPRGTNVSWKNHGKYVSCMAHATNDFVEAGLITEEEKDAIMAEAGQSSCGH